MFSDGARRAGGYWGQGILLLSVFFVSHGLVWALISYYDQRPWGDILLAMDGMWYAEIASQSYQGQAWAFYPLLPLLIRGASFLLPFEPQWLGALISSFCLVGFSAVVIHLMPAVTSSRQAPLLPRSMLGLVLLVWSPSSFVFHANLTEALFLLLSFGSFYGAARGWNLRASALAGLCALTRSQGVFVAMAVGLQLGMSCEGSMTEKIKRFVGSGTVSASLFALYPLYQAVAGGSPFLSVYAQENWAHVSSLTEYVQTFWFANAWQNTKLSSLLHHGWFFVMLYGACLVWKRNQALAFYCFLSLAIMPMQGELVNGFRFSAVLFPIFFVLADRLKQCPKMVRLGVLGILLMLNLLMTASYALGRWAY